MTHVDRDLPKRAADVVEPRASGERAPSGPVLAPQDADRTPPRSGRGPNDDRAAEALLGRFRQPDEPPLAGRRLPLAMIVLLLAGTAAVLVLVPPGRAPSVPPVSTGRMAGAVADRSNAASLAPRSEPSAALATSAPPVATLPPSGGQDAPPLEAVDQELRVWEDAFGDVHAQVVVTARNRGAAPLAIEPSSASWRVLDQAGAVVASGRFPHAFPSIVRPGAEAFLIDGLSATFAQVDELAVLDVELAAEAVDADGRGTTAVPLAIDGLAWERSPTGGIEVTGRVVNTSGMPVQEASVGVVLRDAEGDLLGGAYDVALGAIGPGAAAAFATDYPGLPPMDGDEVAEATGVAYGSP
jgi:hypothetical protein